ncbi:hypothetical protein N7447_008971 [Penicillium robsamsonii]|uniref:uncharacterized protein n=1 Tax=Penicillium robsamsonii TaxID=1792511 RepID=UPI002548E819|nr:uncharacterized protein N7447_008971 [Penicillium robsamsonii]KAJ5816738.1 hypothetical protein N7447_008971 [Penicillium robsamsonii]
MNPNHFQVFDLSLFGKSPTTDILLLSISISPFPPLPSLTSPTSPIFKVGYISDAANSKSCAHCAKQHKVCESVPEGIEGNRFEILSLLAWPEHIWLTSEGEYGAFLDQRDGDGDPVEFALPEDLIMAVLEAV